MLRNNYFGETKTHYKLYKCGKNWAIMGISLFSLGLGMLVTSRPVSADVAVVSTSNKLEADKTTSGEISSAPKSDTTSAASSNASKANTASTASSSTPKSDTTSVTSSSASKANTASTASSSTPKSDTTSVTSSSASKANTVSTASSSTPKSDTTSAASSSTLKTDTASTASSSTPKSDTTSAASSSASKANTASTASSSTPKSDATSASSSSAIDSKAVQVSSDVSVSVKADTDSSSTNPLDSTSKAYILDFSLTNSSSTGNVISKGSTFNITISPDERVSWDKFLKYNSIVQSNAHFTLVDNNDGTATIKLNDDLSAGTYNFILNLYTQDAGYDWDKDAGTHTTNPDPVSGEVAVGFTTNGETTPIFNQAVYVKPLGYNPSPSNVPGFAGAGNNGVAGLNSDNYKSESAPVNVGNNTTLRNPNDKNSNGQLYFSYVVNYQATIGGKGGAILGITSDDSFDLNDYHLYYTNSDGTYTDITNNSLLKWNVTANSITVNAGSYLDSNNLWGALFLRAYVPEESINAINHTSFVTGWYAYFTNTSMFQNVDGDTSKPYFRGEDAEIYTSQIYRPETDVYAYEGVNNLTGSIKIVNYGGYPQDGVHPASGNYTLTYSVTDAEGNVITFTRNIKVIKDSTTIDTKDSTLVAGPHTTWSAADNFVSATDADGKALSLADLKVSG
ncbi:KxYKxGKxW signal peptide domain-containing protein, partial [Lactiplantibacillus mudanjiangensis]|uniref:KxYKxGKxW signal peptide domain-containing protein n=1 Tax=Lactiplantibacillus mudanjiangensis TaxID=1296538 RepID=UPI0017843C7F